MAIENSHSVVERLKRFAGHLERETYALYLAYKDPRVPWIARVFTALVVAHTLSPIDTIPDFIPVLGYLDDLIITPLGIYLALKMIPEQVMAEARQKAAEAQEQGKIHSRGGILIVVLIWMVGLVILGVVIFRIINR